MTPQIFIFFFQSGVVLPEITGEAAIIEGADTLTTPIEEFDGGGLPPVELKPRRKTKKQIEAELALARLQAQNEVVTIIASMLVP